MKSFLIITVLSICLAFAQNPSVTYNKSSKGTFPTNLNVTAGSVTASSITNTSATASTMAGYGSDKKLVTRQVVNADVAAGAAIDATKIANGTVSNAEFQLLDGQTAIGTAGTVINTGTPVLREVPMYSDLTGTNVVPSNIALSSDGNDLFAPGAVISKQFKAGPVTALTGTNWTIDVGAVKSATGTMTADTTLTITGAASTNLAATIIRLLSDGTDTLTLAGSNINGSAPGTVPPGVQWMRITSAGGTNYVTLDWMLSSTNGFLKQTALGLDVDTTDYFTITTDLQADVVSLDNRVTAIEDQLNEAVYEIMFGQQTTYTPVNTSNYWFGGDIATTASAMSYTNESLPFLQNGTIKAISMHLRNTAGSSEATSFSLDINNGSTFVVVSTNVDFSKTVTKQVKTGLSVAVTTNDWFAMKQLPNTWSSPPSSIRSRFRILFRPD